MGTSLVPGIRLPITISVSYTHLTLFHAEITDGVPQLLEHNAICWIAPEEIDGYDFCPADEEILARLRLEGKTAAK